jgi:hypothetical protein
MEEQELQVKQQLGGQVCDVSFIPAMVKIMESLSATGKQEFASDHWGPGQVCFKKRNGGASLPALGRLRQKDKEFEGYIARPCFKSQLKKKKKKS